MEPVNMAVSFRIIERALRVEVLHIVFFKCLRVRKFPLLCYRTDVWGSRTLVYTWTIVQYFLLCNIQQCSNCPQSLPFSCTLVSCPAITRHIICADGRTVTCCMLDQCLCLYAFIRRLRKLSYFCEFQRWTYAKVRMRVLLSLEQPRNR